MNETTTIADWLEASLARSQDGARALDWLRGARAEVAGGTDDTRFCALLSTASRHVRPRPLAPSDKERAAADALVPGLEVERWNRLEAARALLVLARPDLAGDAGAAAVEEAFRFADEGEACALYRCLALLPAGGRFAWRAGEGCRTNMRTVFEAAALDTPFPARHFDDVAYRQAAIKAVFVGAPLWRLVGLDGRLGPELARMALDLVDERRSAHRTVQHELWLCLGTHGGERGVRALEEELRAGGPRQRSAAAYGLARAGERERLAARLEEERDPAVAESMQNALSGDTSQRAFRELETPPA